MKTLIISGGTIEDSFAEEYIRQWQPDYLLAADKGMEYCYRAGRKPDCIIGDYDSASPEVFSYFRNQSGIEWHDYQPEKDYADSEIAMMLAIGKGSTDIHMLGATGTRLDHVIGNVHLLKKALEHHRKACIVDSHNRIRLVQGELCLYKEEQFGTYLSILPLTDELRGVNLNGLKYSLKDAVMTKGNTLGISNEIVAHKAAISVEKGIALVIESKD